MVFDKKVFLRLLEEDEEFRLAVAAKIGLLEILSKLESHDKKFNEILEELRLHRKKLEEHDKRFEVIERKLLEHDKRFETIEKKLLEHDRKFDEILGEIKRIWEELRRHNEILDKHTRMLGALGNDIGALTEATLSRFIRDDLFDEIKLMGERIIMTRRMYVVNVYEVDLYIETDKAIYVVEVKTRPSIEDVRRLSRIKEHLAKKMDKNIKAILATLKAKTTLDILSETRKLGVELITY